MPHYLTENGTARQFVDGKVIQGNFVKKLYHSQAIFPPNIYLNERTFCEKYTQNWGTCPNCSSAHMGGATPPPPSWSSPNHPV